MFLEQVLHEDLGCASYVVGDGGEAVVVDPRWDVDVYERVAAARGARIVAVADTHDHADHLSGRARLARRTGATAHRPARAGASRPGDLRHGDELRAGDVVLRALAAPGHRPEHLALAVIDGARCPEPCALLAGDSLLVGAVARPDLAVAPREGAAELHGTLRRLLDLGDHVELWPAHVGGSLCGGAGLSDRTSSTIGFERRCTPELALDAPTFVERVGNVSQPKPPNAARVAQLNAAGLEQEPTPAPLLDAAGLRRALDGGATVLDGRAPGAFDAAHLAGSVLIPLSGKGIGTRAGWAVHPDERLVLVADCEAEARRFAVLLQAVALCNVTGVAVADPGAWRAHGLPVRKGGTLELDVLARRIGEGGPDLDLVDVREAGEFAGGHVRGSRSLPLSRLGDGRGARFARDRRIAVVCARGGRAAIAASLLRRAGNDDVVRVIGGVPDLAAHGVTLERA